MSLLDSACRIGHRKYLLNELINDYRIHTTPKKKRLSCLLLLIIKRVPCIAKMIDYIYSRVKLMLISLKKFGGVIVCKNSRRRIEQAQDTTHFCLLY